MPEQGSTASRKPDKRKQREARNDLSRYLNKLKQVCNTIETANDWVAFVGELNNLLQLYKFEIPEERQSGLTQAMNLADPSREGIAQACSVLELELEKAIESLPARSCGCGCLGGSLAAVVIGLVILVGLIIALGVFFLRPVEVNVLNAGCGPMFVRQGIPVEMQPVINFLGVELPDVIDTNDQGRFQVPGLPLQVGVNGTGRKVIVVSVLGFSVPFDVSGGASFIEVNGEQVLGNSFTIGVREYDPHNVIIGCE